MKKAFLSVLFLGFLAVSAFAQGGVPFILQEVDGSPKVQSPTIIKVSNGTLTCVQKVCTISTGGGGGGSGDVVGPASATDNAVVRFDLTTGKLVQN